MILNPISQLLGALQSPQAPQQTPAAPQFSPGRFQMAQPGNSGSLGALLQLGAGGQLPNIPMHNNLAFSSPQIQQQLAGALQGSIGSLQGTPPQAPNTPSNQAGLQQLMQMMQQAMSQGQQGPGGGAQSPNGFRGAPVMGGLTGINGPVPGRTITPITGPGLPNPPSGMQFGGTPSTQQPSPWQAYNSPPQTVEGSFGPFAGFGGGGGGQDQNPFDSILQSMF